MPKDSPFDPLYAAPIVLWVEDSTTEQYLSEVWQQLSLLRIHIAGNSEAVQALVSAAERAKFRHVFGLIDRDLGTTNKPNWATKRVFRLPRHEIENYFLDANDLFDCSLHNRRRTVADIQAKLSELASQQPAWLAYRKVLREIEKFIGKGQPGVPALLTIPSEAEALGQIRSSLWFTGLGQRAAEWLTPGKLEQEIQTAFQRFSQLLGSGGWIEEFSGKEIFSTVRDYLYTPKRGTSSDHDADFAAQLGVRQLANNRVPQDIIDLLAAMRRQVGLPVV